MHTKMVWQSALDCIQHGAVSRKMSPIRSVLNSHVQKKACKHSISVNKKLWIPPTPLLSYQGPQNVSSSRGCYEYSSTLPYMSKVQPLPDRLYFSVAFIGRLINLPTPRNITSSILRVRRVVGAFLHSLSLHPPRACLLFFPKSLLLSYDDLSTDPRSRSLQLPTFTDREPYIPHLYE